jgi:hypothetical protein
MQQNESGLHCLRENSTKHLIFTVGLFAKSEQRIYPRRPGLQHHTAQNADGSLNRNQNSKLTRHPAANNNNAGLESTKNNAVQAGPKALSRRHFSPTTLYWPLLAQLKPCPFKTQKFAYQKSFTGSSVGHQPARRPK